MQTLTHELANVLTALHAALPDEAGGNGAGAAGRDPASIQEPLLRLKQLLETDDGEAADFIVDASPHLAGVLTAAEIKVLTDRVGKFEFDSALQCLSSIAARLSLDLDAK